MPQDILRITPSVVTVGIAIPARFTSRSRSTRRWLEGRDTERMMETGGLSSDFYCGRLSVHCCYVQRRDLAFLPGWRTIASRWWTRRRRRTAPTATVCRTTRHQASGQRCPEPWRANSPVLPGATFAEKIAAHEASRHATKLSGEKKKFRCQDRVPLFAKAGLCLREPDLGDGEWQPNPGRNRREPLLTRRVT